MLLDCGVGSFESLAILRPDVRLDAIILSHAHPDHVADLEALVADASHWQKAAQVFASRETIDGTPMGGTSIAAGTVNYVP